MYYVKYLSGWTWQPWAACNWASVGTKHVTLWNHQRRKLIDTILLYSHNIRSSTYICRYGCYLSGYLDVAFDSQQSNGDRNLIVVILLGTRIWYLSMTFEYSNRIHLVIWILVRQQETTRCDLVAVVGRHFLLELNLLWQAEILVSPCFTITWQLKY